MVGSEVFLVKWKRKNRGKVLTDAKNEKDIKKLPNEFPSNSHNQRKTPNLPDAFSAILFHFCWFS